MWNQFADRSELPDSSSLEHPIQSVASGMIICMLILALFAVV